MDDFRSRKKCYKEHYDIKRIIMASKETTRGRIAKLCWHGDMGNTIDIEEKLSDFINQECKNKIWFFVLWQVKVNLTMIKHRIVRKIEDDLNKDIH